MKPIKPGMEQWTALMASQLAATLLLIVSPALPAQSKSPTSPAKKTMGEIRVLHFPATQACGQLYFIPMPFRDPRGNEEWKSITPAKGDIKVAVPPGQGILLELNKKVIDEPQWLEKVSPEGIDGLREQYIGMDENEQKIPDRLMDFIPHLKNLNVLIISRSDVTDKSLPKIASLKKLDWLEATGTTIHGTNFKDLLNLPNLTHLDFGFSTIDRNNLTYLARLPRLKMLCLDNAQINAESINFLADSPSIETLSISNNLALDDRSIPALLRMKKLKNLHLNGTSISLHSVKKLSALNLESLTLPNQVKKTDLPELQKLFKKTNLVIFHKHVNQEENALFEPITR
ncbi:MAG: hypothetical protein KGS72_00135 [Cyanobacteria bacterium REEB67]|nr:hypothetical protein [Cyanobacteria bacterium REEB67]